MAARAFFLGMMGAALAVAGMAAVARAQPPDEAQARSLFEEGLAAAGDDQWDRAVGLFRQSLAIAERPATAYNLAFALEQLARVVEAREALELYFRIAEPRDSRRRDAEALRAEVAGRIVTLHLSVSPPGATVVIDGEPREGSGPERTIELDPGTHTVEVSAPGHASESVPLTAVAGAGLVQSVELVPESGGAAPVEDTTGQMAEVTGPSPPPSGADEGGGGPGPLPWIVIGGSAALVATGVAFIVLARSDISDVEDPPTGATWSDIENAYDRAPRRSAIGFTLLGVGIAAAATGVVLLVLGGADDDAETSVSFGPRGVSLRTDW